MKDSDLEQIDFGAFEESYSSARGYHRRAKQFAEEGQFHSVVFNVSSVALEHYLIALCRLYGIEPGNHSYTCLMDEVENIIDIPQTFNAEIRSLDLMFGICSLENFHLAEPGVSDSNRVMIMCDEVGKLFDQARISALKKLVRIQ